MEEWRDIKGYEGIYMVSSLGRVRSLDKKCNCLVNKWGYRIATTRKGKIKTLHQDRNGYISVELFDKGKRRKINVHRLVAIAFIDNPNNYGDVNHIDSDKTNNRVENLEWVTRQGNMLHAISKGHSGAYKLRTPVNVYKNDLLVGTFPSCSSAASFIGGRCSDILSCIRGRQHSHRGYTFKKA